MNDLCQIFRNNSSDTYNPCPGIMEDVPATREYDNGFATSLMIKDIKLALESAET